MLTALRRELYREATTQLARDVLKGTRWLLLKSLNNLDEERDEPGRRLQTLQLNRSQAIAYSLKDDLNELREQTDKQAAACWLDQWLEAADTSGIRLLQRQAFGYRDFEFFRLKLYALHRMRYALVG